MVIIILLRSIVVTALILFSWSVFAESTEGEQVEEGWSEEEWQEEELSSTSEWIENIASPVTRWIEQKVQAPAAVQDTGNIPTIENLPEDVISPQEAARLLLLLFPGKVLNIEYLPKPINVYQIKHLSEGGSVAQYYLLATDGTLLDELPEAPPQIAPSTSDADSASQ